MRVLSQLPFGFSSPDAVEYGLVGEPLVEFSLRHFVAEVVKRYGGCTGGAISWP